MKRSAFLRVIGGYVVLDEHVPAVRDECRDGHRPCPHIRCRAHLWLTLDHDRCGRPHGGRRPPSTLRRVFMQFPVPQSCMWDVVESLAPNEGLERDEVGELLGITGERVRQIEEAALAKLKAEHGDLLAGEIIRQGRDENVVATKGLRKSQSTKADAVTRPHDSVTRRVKK